MHISPAQPGDILMQTPCRIFLMTFFQEIFHISGGTELSKLSHGDTEAVAPAWGLLQGAAYGGIGDMVTTEHPRYRF